METISEETSDGQTFRRQTGSVLLTVSFTYGGELSAEEISRLRFAPLEMTAALPDNQTSDRKRRFEGYGDNQ